MQKLTKVFIALAQAVGIMVLIGSVIAGCYFGGAAVTSAVVAGGILFFIGYKIGKSDAPQPASETARY